MAVLLFRDLASSQVLALIIIHSLSNFCWEYETGSFDAAEFARYPNWRKVVGYALKNSAIAVLHSSQ